MTGSAKWTNDYLGPRARKIVGNTRESGLEEKLRSMLFCKESFFSSFYMYFTNILCSPILSISTLSSLRAESARARRQRWSIFSPKRNYGHFTIIPAGTRSVVNVGRELFFDGPDGPPKFR